MESKTIQDAFSEQKDEYTMKIAKTEYVISSVYTGTQELKDKLLRLMTSDLEKNS